MKKLWNIAFGYFLAAMAGGVFYREFTKFFAFSGKTVLEDIHVHLLVLGTVVFLFLGLAAKTTDLLEQKKFGLFLKLYNVALPVMVFLMLCRGVIQTAEISISNGADAAIAGIAGLTHIAMAALWIFLFRILRKLK